MITLLQRPRPPSIGTTMVAITVATLAACTGGHTVDDGAAPDEALPANPALTALTAASGTSVDLGLPGPHLAVIVDEGGSCGADPCVVVVEFAADGSWLLARSGGESAEGTYDADSLADLARVAPSAEVRLGPFRGQCPSLNGGVERSYLVLSPDDPGATVLDLSTCRDQIDADTDLVVALDLLVLDASR